MSISRWIPVMRLPRDQRYLTTTQQNVTCLVILAVLWYFENFCFTSIGCVLTFTMCVSILLAPSAISINGFFISAETLCPGGKGQYYPHLNIVLHLPERFEWTSLMCLCLMIMLYILEAQPLILERNYAILSIFNLASMMG